jgi:hypothetical protein
LIIFEKSRKFTSTKPSYKPLLGCSLNLILKMRLFLCIPRSYSRSLILNFLSNSRLTHKYAYFDSFKSLFILSTIVSPIRMAGSFSSMSSEGCWQLQYSKGINRELQFLGCFNGWNKLDPLRLRSEKSNFKVENWVLDVQLVDFY